MVQRRPQRTLSALTAQLHHLVALALRLNPDGRHRQPELRGQTGQAHAQPSHPPLIEARPPQSLRQRQRRHRQDRQVLDRQARGRRRLQAEPHAQSVQLPHLLQQHRAIDETARHREV